MVSGGGGSAAGGASYAYGGGGRRVKKGVYNGETTVFVYDALGRPVAEYSNTVESNGALYLTQDPLGSTRIISGQDQLVKSRHDYFPFGEELSIGRSTYVNNGDVRRKFGTYEHDDESGLDYA